MNFRRFWLALVYGLTTIVVQGLHDHGGAAIEESAACLSSCDDPKPHVAGHDSPEVRSGDLDCLACQFRSDHQAATVRPVSTVEPAPRLIAIHPGNRVGRLNESRPSARAPPLV